jgi:phosphatidylinositol alpha-1,6-mannosyltransferase
VSWRAGSPRYLVLTPGMTGTDGIAEVSRLVVRAISPSGTEPDSARVDVLSLTDPPGFRAGGGPGVRFFGAGRSRFRFVAAAVRAGLGGARAVPILCLHLHLSPVAQLLAGRSRLAVFLHGIEAWRPLRRMERLALHRAGIVMANSEHTVKRFRESNPDFQDRSVRVCHLAVRDRDGVSVGLESGERVARPWRGPFALIVGRMAAEERYKGHDLLIDIWPSIMDEVRGARLVVVGDGDDRARLEARASHLTDHVSFLGRVSDGVLAGLYRDCAFFVMPSRDEGFGLVFLEAMRAGKACIGGVGAAAEVIEDGDTGFVVEQDREPLRRAVVRLFREPETRERMGEAGAARVAREFTEAHFRLRFRALLGLPPAADNGPTVSGTRG